jgi:hypothetical protein
MGYDLPDDQYPEQEKYLTEKDSFPSTEAVKPFPRSDAVR